jgi:16S rRNA processing protein RimM
MTSRRRETAARRKEKHLKKEAGAPEVVPPAFLLVGILHRPHGVRGEMIMSIMTDFPERLKPGMVLFLGIEHTPVTIKSLRHHNRGLLIALEGFNSREEVAVFRNYELFVRADDRPPLPEGEYYLHQIIGLNAFSDEGQNLGVITEWIETGANGVYIVRDEAGKEILLPDIDEVVLKIDLEQQQMTVHLLEGLVE